MLLIARLWLLTFVPVVMTVMPIGNLTVLLLFVLTVDTAIALLLARDLCAYRTSTSSTRSLHLRVHAQP